MPRIEFIGFNIEGSSLEIYEENPIAATVIAGAPPFRAVGIVQALILNISNDPYSGSLFYHSCEPLGLITTRSNPRMG